MEPSDASGQNSCSTCGAGWKFPLLLAVVLVGVVLARSFGIRDSEQAIENRALSGGAASASESATLAVDFGDAEPRQFTAVPWHEGMTIEDLLGAVGQRPDGPEFAKQGSGASALLTRIGERANEGAGGRNWTYQVNGERGNRSFAIYELKPGDRVLWRFGPQE